MLIPTSCKRPLARDHSYPIGAQAISDALVEAPQFAELDVSFYDFAKSRYEQGGRYLVLAAEYKHQHAGLTSANAFIESGWYEPQWHLVIYAVPRKRRHSVNSVLVSSALSKVKQWLSEPRIETWLDTSHRFEIEFDPVSLAVVGTDKR